ncbi:hypothetical protein B7P43_G16034 [Cryptotermes secundus]|uniref:Uncharacterized protein n=1 Tax=Cryptotermes secundus TaxID=105785 RepID=A0A2J7PDU7_9NEOP|nr:uncharacterized protein LOC111874621 [Cryptotermes secundus]PNF14498.1 hypothetical protein B7P43_G16034 [Cryptotermes secundus]
MKSSVLLVAFFFTTFVYQATASPYARHRPGSRYPLHISGEATSQFGYDYLDDETSDSGEVSQEPEEPLGRSLTDSLIYSLIKMVRIFFGYLTPTSARMAPYCSLRTPTYQTANETTKVTVAL